MTRCMPVSGDWGSRCATHRAMVARVQQLPTRSPADLMRGHSPALLEQQMGTETGLLPCAVYHS